MGRLTRNRFARCATTQSEREKGSDRRHPVDAHDSLAKTHAPTRKKAETEKRRGRNTRTLGEARASAMRVSLLFFHFFSVAIGWILRLAKASCVAFMGTAVLIPPPSGRSTRKAKKKRKNDKIRCVTLAGLLRKCCLALALSASLATRRTNRPARTRRKVLPLFSIALFPLFFLFPFRCLLK